MRQATAVVATWLLVCAAASAQDMRLSDVLIEGSGWQPDNRDVRHLWRTGGKPPRAVSPDGGTVVTADKGGRHLLASRLDAGGKESATERYYELRVPSGQRKQPVGGMTFDSERRLYVATATGVQVFDPTGRLIGELLPPERGKAVKDVAFLDKDRHVLLVLSESGHVFSRVVKSKGQTPAKEK